MSDDTKDNPKKLSSDEIAKALEEKVASSGEGAVSLLSEEVLIFILDCSGSMASSMGGASKFGAMLKAAERMLQERVKTQDSSNDIVGIIAFGVGDTGYGYGDPESEIKLVAYPGIVTDQMCKDVASLRCRGGTPMYRALVKAFELLDQTARGLGRVVLLSDGKPTGSGQSAILEYAKKICEDTGFVLDTVGIGDPNTGYSYDQNFMEKLAEDGGGEFYECDEADALAARLLEMESERRVLIGKGVMLLGDGSENE